ncbi:MAG: hypothetical protein NY202_03745, partial [Mollicutes bacterium UO1]
SKEPYHIELIGRYSHSEKSIRKSFTCFDYHINKECFACGDNFSTTQQLDYDYCSPSGINGSRYLPRHFTKNNCSGCGDGSGIIKFPKPPRKCKTYYLTTQLEKGENLAQ